MCQMTAHARHSNHSNQLPLNAEEYREIAHNFIQSILQLIMTAHKKINHFLFYFIAL